MNERRNIINFAEEWLEIIVEALKDGPN
jgi:hypothetical protein